jgi:ATP-dependent protease ClpP protease subunit|tara:strand:+ start:784 stop:1092 length:309 start_codon:yes stop_codon:yes gene_type:complete
MAFAAPTGNVTGLQDIYSYVNSTVGGFFFMGISIALFMVVFIKLLYNTDNNGQAFTAASFLTMIVVILLRIGDLVPTPFMIFFILATAGGTVWMHYENARFN